MDYFKAVGGLGLGSRLKRLSDTYLSEVKILYAEQGYDFEPRWFPLFSLLFHQNEVTVTSAAEELNLTHPHISQLTKELIKSKLVRCKDNPKDARSRILSLTEKGKKLALEIQPLWGGIQAAVDEIIIESDPQFLSSLEKMEVSLRKKSFSQRVKDLKRSDQSGDCRILDYSPKFKKYFETLNREWIEKFFVIEPHDLKVFANPEKEILKRGGEIIFAEFDGKIVGTCALTYSDGVYELAKLAVSDQGKGKKIGELLSMEIIKRARAKGAKSLQLTTNSNLVPAVHLYEKLGFKEIFKGQHPKYKRVNLVMEKRL
jgi:DNA-binding MarR family transcriptional regulator/ribosomal protein S18 acetylase RimI-like enzyme